MLHGRPCSSCARTSDRWTRKELVRYARANGISSTKKTIDQIRGELVHSINDYSDNEEGAIFVENIPFSMNEEDLQRIVGRWGEIKGIAKVGETDSGWMARVEYVDERDADDAIRDMDGHVVGANTLRVYKARPRSRQRRPS